MQVRATSGSIFRCVGIAGCIAGCVAGCIAVYCSGVAVVLQWCCSVELSVRVSSGLTSKCICVAGCVAGCVE